MIKDNYVQYFETSIRDNWELNALSDYKGKTLTYAQIGRQLLALHEIYQKAGIKQGEKIGVVGGNTVNWGIIYLSAITYGAVIVPILPDFHSEDIHHIVNHSDTVLLFLSQYHYDQIDEEKMPALLGLVKLEDFTVLYEQKKLAKSSLSRLFSEFLYDSDFKPTPGDMVFEKVPNELLAAIVYTSGTTGLSKGVMLSHNCMLANLLYARANMPLTRGNSILSFLPLAHAYGCAFEFLFPFTLGCHVTFLGKIPSPKVIVKAFNEIKPELILSVPLIIEKIYRKQLKPIISKEPIKTMLSIPLINSIIGAKINKKLSAAFGNNFLELVLGGAAFSPEVENFMRKIKFPYTIGYGMTECGPLISYASWKTTKQASVGKVVDWLEIKVDSPDPAKVIGEVLVRGESVMDGYYKNEEATKETFEADGWMHTGDLGIIDKEGYIYLTGRKKNMILGPSGHNVYPEELEARLNNMPYVMESLVVEREGKLTALVYPDFVGTDTSQIKDPKLIKLMEENRKKLNDKLPVYSKVTAIELIPEEFVKTPTNKVKRYLYAK